LSDPTSQAQRIISRWRKVFLGIYLAFVMGSVVVVFVSLMAVHCGVYRVPIVGGKRIAEGGRNPIELRDCHRRLASLLTDLHRETFTLLGRAQRFATEPATEWRNWTRDWRHRWRLLDYRCRLSELSGRDTSPAIDKMAHIHAALDELHISYTGVVNNFAERYVDRLRGLKQEVDAARAIIDKQQRRSHRPGATQ